MKKSKQALTVALAIGGLLNAASTVQATNGNPINSGSAETYTLSVIGDVPYGATKVNAFPSFIDFINADPKVDIVVHVGDIKSGSTVCSDEYFELIKTQFDRLKDPLVYAPGDNEWTDCHRANNGAYLPIERLAKLRDLFFANPGQTLGGRKKRVLTQANDPLHSDFVENVMWMESKVLFVDLNVPGSNDDNVTTNPWGAPWNDALYKAAQAAEQASRDAANLDWLKMAFTTGTANDARGLVIFLQADMWDTTAPAGQLASFEPLIKAIGEQSVAFAKPVLLIVGDSHIFHVDNPYDPADPLHTLHAGTPTALNLTRIIVQGSTTAPKQFEYLRLTVNPRSSQIFSWERVPLDIP